MTDPLTRAREAIARHESQHNQDPFHFSLTDHKYVALLLLVNYCEQLERDRSATALENRSLLEENLTMTAPPTDNEREAAERIATVVGMVPDTGQHRVTARAALLGIQYGFRRQGPITDDEREALSEAPGCLYEDCVCPLGHATSPTKDQRDPECVKRWPECESFAYDPRCCRFPKSCSAGVIRREDG